MSDPYEVATWRFEMIAPFVDDTLTPAQRRAALRDRTRSAVRWPDGGERPVSRTTLQRWVRVYRREGLQGLLRAARKDRGKPRSDRAEWVDKAVALLLERPSRSLYFVLQLLKAEDPSLPITRSTLHRDLQRHPQYALVLRQRRGHRKLRTRFEAKAPHDIWQLDAKGPFTVRFADGTARRLTVLSILDDNSRALLGVTIVEKEALAGAVRLFRATAARWGLPAKIYCDRHSAYDSIAFRTGLATLGVNRIHARARNAPARGKIERYHRVLEAWFLGELEHQVVLDGAHLEELLQAFKDIIYQPHRHRGLKQSPAEALADRRSPREVSVDDLRRGFWVAKTKKAHPATGEIELAGALLRVPAACAGRCVQLRYDPVDPERAVIVTSNGEEIALVPARQHAGDARGARAEAATPAEPRRAPGRLQRLVDRWRGRELPIAPAGFGLPEVFVALAAALGRPVPRTEAEAATIQAFYRVNGPFTAIAFDAALVRAREALGAGRPLQVVLAFLIKRLGAPRSDDRAVQRAEEETL